MKKFLFGTTALISAATLSSAAFAGGMDTSSAAGGKMASKSSSVAAGGLGVSVGGFIDFQAGFGDQDSAFETGVNSREAKFQNDTEIHISVDGKADNGLKYGAVIELNADVSGDGDADGGNADKTYIYLESTAGRVELGSTSTVTSNQQVSAASIARATGGIDGDWYDFANIGAAFIRTQELPAAESGEGSTREDSNKIAYYSPVFSGLQFGLSFAPDEGDSGTIAGATGECTTLAGTTCLVGDVENSWGVGLTYATQYENVDVNASIVGEFGSAEAAGVEDTSAWGIGLALGFQGFSIAGSWTDWADSGLATGTANDNQESWTLGAAYETGPFGVSVTYLESEAGGATEQEFNNLVLGADYQLAPGLVPYVEVSFFDTDDNNVATTDNDGSVVLVGAELSF
jgi:hypothetical protein